MLSCRDEPGDASDKPPFPAHIRFGRLSDVLRTTLNPSSFSPVPRNMVWVAGSDVVVDSGPTVEEK